MKKTRAKRPSWKGVTATYLTLVVLLPLASPAEALGQAPSQPNVVSATKDVKFEVISIRPHVTGANGFTFYTPSPDGFHSNFTSVRALIYLAYSPFPTPNSGVMEIYNEPAWLNRDMIDVDARVAPEDIAAWQAQGVDKPLFRNALQALLKERCNLVVHTTESQAPYWDIVVGKGGPKLHGASHTYTRLPNTSPLFDGGSADRTPREQSYHDATIGELASILSRDSYPLPVQDKTGLTGHYDFTLNYEDFGDSERHTTIEMVSRSLAQLGLAIKQGRGRAINIYIDHVEPPSPN